MEYLAILLVFFLLNVGILVLGLKKKRFMLLFLSLSGLLLVCLIAISYVFFYSNTL